MFLLSKQGFYKIQENTPALYENIVKTGTYEKLKGSLIEATKNTMQHALRLDQSGAIDATTTVTNANQYLQYAFSLPTQVLQSIPPVLIQKVLPLTLITAGITIIYDGELSMLTNDIYNTFQNSLKYSQDILNNLLKPIKNAMDKLPTSLEDKYGYDEIGEYTNASSNITNANSGSFFDYFKGSTYGPSKNWKPKSVLEQIEDMPEVDPGIFGQGRKKKKLP